MRPIRPSLRLALIALVATALVGCYRIALRDSDGERDASVPGVDGTSSMAVSVRVGAVPSATGCGLEYRIYRPAAPVPDGLVILAHGFLRSKERMDGLARALADSGMTAATLDFCNSRPWAGRHFQNGLDMVEVTDAIGATRVVYAGFSAGGLAALVAGRRDPRSLGVLALDLVDDDELGVRMAEGLQTPLIGIMGEPTACNARGNGMPIFAASPRGRVETLAGAGHCDFESPTDWLCEAVCERPEGASSELRASIIESAVAAIEGLMAQDETDPSLFAARRSGLPAVSAN
jgi:hypothetical protein